jgi:hypothetical protein
MIVPWRRSGRLSGFVVPVHSAWLRGRLSCPTTSMIPFPDAHDRPARAAALILALPGAALERVRFADVVDRADHLFSSSTWVAADVDRCVPMLQIALPPDEPDPVGRPGDPASSSSTAGCAMLAAVSCASHRADTCSGTDVLVQGFSPPLVAAAGNGDLERVRQLLQSGADPNGQDCDDFVNDQGVVTKQLGFTPLMLAVGHGYLEVAEVLVRAGADPNRATSDGRTAMSFAVESGRPEAVALMRRVGGR